VKGAGDELPRYKTGAEHVSLLAAADDVDRRLWQRAKPTTPQKKLTAIEVGPKDSTIAVGATLQFSATGQYDDGSTGDVTVALQWASSDATMASISSGGKATGTGIGEVKDHCKFRIDIWHCKPSASSPHSVGRRDPQDASAFGILLDPNNRLEICIYCDVYIYGKVKNDDRSRI
jgi:hypothetical protein